MVIFGWCVAQRIKFFCSKSLKSEYPIKSRDLPHCDKNTHFDSENMLKKLNLKNLWLCTPHEEKHQISRFPRFFGQKFPNWDWTIFFTFEICWISRYTCVAHFGKVSWLQVAAFSIYGILTEDQNFLVKTLKIWVSSKIKRLASFSLKFSHNTYITNTNRKKKRFLNISNFDLPQRNPHFPRFS